MKSLLSLFSFFLLTAGTTCAQQVVVPNTAWLTGHGQSLLTNAKLTGRLTTTGNSDFRRLRDLCWQLHHLDLSEAECPVVPDNAFFALHSLRSIRLSEQTVRLGDYAFYACDSLSGTLVLPDALQSIGQSAFSGCRQLTGVRFGKSLRSIGAFAFVQSGLRGALVLPDSLQSIGDGAFSGLSGLTEITLPAGLQVVGPGAFADCTSLTLLRVRSPQPPYLAANALEGVDVERLRLDIPEEYRAAYEKACIWGPLLGKDVICLGTTIEVKPLVPQPAEVESRRDDSFSWSELGAIEAPAALANEKERLLDVLREHTIAPLSALRGKGRIVLALDKKLPSAEAYTLDIGPSRIEIKGKTAAGVFYGIQTLRQLLIGSDGTRRRFFTSSLRIADAPRTKVRELMIDPARQFIPLPDIKRMIVEMSRYKLNSLHLHLVDDQGWRIEIKSYPLLTQKGSWRASMDDRLKPVAGFYTQAEMRELVAFAAKYHVDIVPEIELPGHERAAIHCYPELTCSKQQFPITTTTGVQNTLLCPSREFTYTFLGNVFRELADIFPSPYVHLGGDEAGIPPLDQWTHCPDCQKKKLELGITTTDRSENWKLQKYLFDRMIDTLRTQYNKQPMFWYETDFAEIPEGCVTFAWRAGVKETRQAIDAAVRNKARLMMVPGQHCYFDYPMAADDMPEKNWGMPVLPLKNVYDLDPAFEQGEEFERNHLLGVAGTLWSECMPESERIFYMAFPRAMALAEVGWTPAKRRSYDDFLQRLRPLLDDLGRRGGCYSLKF